MRERLQAFPKVRPKQFIAQRSDDRYAVSLLLVPMCTPPVLIEVVRYCFFECESEGPRSSTSSRKIVLPGMLLQIKSPVLDGGVEHPL